MKLMMQMIRSKIDMSIGSATYITNVMRKSNPALIIDCNAPLLTSDMSTAAIARMTTCTTLKMTVASSDSMV